MENTFQKVIFQLEINSECILNALFVNLDKAMEHVFGFTAANDVSGRDWQMKRNGGQWLLGKARISFTVVQDGSLVAEQFGIPIKTFDTFLPLGPYIETDLDPHNLKVRLVDYFNKLCRTLANHIDPVLTVRNIITTVFSAWIDGEKMQDSNTKNLIFDIPVSPFYYSFQFFQKYFRKFFSKFVLSLSSTGSVKYAH